MVAQYGVWMGVWMRWKGARVGGRVKILDGADMGR